jgi:type IV pilus assembly protein PilN
MIKINLLGLKKEVKKSSAPAVSMAGAAVTVAIVAFLAAGLGWDAYRYFTLSAEAAKIADDMKKANAEKTRLAGIKAQFDAMNASKALLVKQIDVIEALERGRTGPAEMLATLANTVVSTKTMWLATFENTGSQVHLTGFATSSNTVADFIRSLKDSGQFTNVELKDTMEDDSKGITTFQFDLTADLTFGKPPAAPPAAGKK